MANSHPFAALFRLERWLTCPLIAAHRLRGGAVSLGCVKVAEIALILETEAQQEAEPGSALANWQEHMATIDSTVAALRASLDAG